MYHAERVFHRDKLAAGGLDIAFGAAQRRQDQRIAAVTRWLRFSLVLMCTVSSQRRSACSVRAVSGGRRRQVASQGNQDLDFTAQHGFQGFHGTVPGRAGAG